MNCTCKYQSIKGGPNGKICSHILAVLKEIVRTASVELVDESVDKFAVIADLNKRRNEVLNLVRVGNRKLNVVRVGKNEGDAHADKKREICKQLDKDGKYFLTEAIFWNGCRADVLVLDDFRVIEIVHSESDESIERKRLLYPKGLKIDVVKV